MCCLEYVLDGAEEAGGGVAAYAPGMAEEADYVGYGVEHLLAADDVCGECV